MKHLNSFLLLTVLSASYAANVSDVFTCSGRFETPWFCNFNSLRPLTSDCSQLIRLEWTYDSNSTRLNLTLHKNTQNNLTVTVRVFSNVNEASLLLNTTIQSSEIDNSTILIKEIDPSLVKCARISLSVLNIKKSLSHFSQFHSSSSNNLCLNQCSNRNINFTLFNKVGTFFRDQFFNNEPNFILLKKKNKRSFFSSDGLPSVGEIGEFLSLNANILKNKTLQSVDWLRDKFETNLNNKIKSVQDESKQKILELILQNSNLSSALDSYLMNLTQSKQQPNSDWLNNLLIVNEEEENKILSLNNSLLKTDIFVKNKVLNSKRKKRALANSLLRDILKPRRKNALKILSTTSSAISNTPNSTFTDSQTNPTYSSVNKTANSFSIVSENLENTTLAPVTSLTASTHSTLSQATYPASTEPEILVTNSTLVSVTKFSSENEISLSNSTLSVAQAIANETITGSEVDNSVNVTLNSIDKLTPIKVTETNVERFLAVNKHEETLPAQSNTAPIQTEPENTTTNLATTSKTLLTFISSTELPNTTTLTSLTSSNVQTTVLESTDKLDFDATSTTSTTTAIPATTQSTDTTTTFRNEVITQTTTPTDLDLNDDEELTTIGDLSELSFNSRLNYNQFRFKPTKIVTITTKPTTISEQEFIIETSPTLPFSGEEETTTAYPTTSSTSTLSTTLNVQQEEIEIEDNSITSTAFNQPEFSNVVQSEANTQSALDLSIDREGNYLTESLTPEELITASGDEEEVLELTTTTTTTTTSTTTTTPQTSTVLDNNIKLEIMNYTILNSNLGYGNAAVPAHKSDSRTYSLRLHIKGFKWNEKFRDPNSPEAQEFLRQKIMPLLFKKLNLKKEDLNEIKLIRLFKGFVSNQSNFEQ